MTPPKLIDSEGQYTAALELTHKMLAAVAVQDWDSFAVIEKQRARIIEDVMYAKTTTSEAQKARIATIITQIEHESAEIIERVHCWQDHAKILLRMKSPSI